MTTSCVYLGFLRSFSEHLFYRALLGDCLFHVQVGEFQPTDTAKTISHVLFKHFIQEQQITIRRRENVKSYLKSLKTIYEKVDL